MNKLFLIFFGLVGFSLFAPPKIVEKLPPFFQPSKEIVESKEYQKAFEKTDYLQASIFLYKGTPYIANDQGQIRHCDTAEKKAVERMKKIVERTSVVKLLEPLPFTRNENDFK